MARQFSFPYRDTGYFNALMCDYLDKTNSTKALYGNFPDLEGFKKQLDAKAASFPAAHRQVLVNHLKAQYATIDMDTEQGAAVYENIEKLALENTFTITTGHQLNLFTGPLYFFYKIVTAINTCKALKQQFPANNFVPVYWMASEDHDFEEIQFFRHGDKKVVWKSNQTGAVGHFKTTGIDQVLEELKVAFGTTYNAQFLLQLFEDAYVKHDTLQTAHLYLVNTLFQEYGLIILDADSMALKNVFVPHIKDDVLNQTAFSKVSHTIAQFPDAYKVQVNPREINFFYIHENQRDRIIERDGHYYLADREDVHWTRDQIVALIDTNPERFSPNVMLRPLYQEVILPNLCYIGGGGELSYWMELKAFFEARAIPFPILLLRNSAVIATQKQLEKAEKLNISVQDLFKKQDVLVNQVIHQISDVAIDFSSQKTHLEKQFEALHQLASQTDASFKGAVAAQEKKQLKGLENLEKRLLRAQKRKLSDHTDRVAALQDALFPNHSLQERYVNFSTLYLEYGDAWLSRLFVAFDPLQLQFDVVVV